MTKQQIEMSGNWEELETALDDVIERLEEIEKLKDGLPDARKRLAEIMFKHGKEQIKHKGRSFAVKETPSVLKLSIRKSQQ